MVLFELNQEGVLEAHVMTKREFSERLEGRIEINLDDLEKKEDYPDAIYREVKLTNEEVIRQNNELLKLFLKTKKLEGCSYETRMSYSASITRFIFDVIKPIDKITCNDVRMYLMNYIEDHNIKYNTLDDMRRILNTFFNWCEEENYVIKNPIKKLHKIKGEEIIKQPFSEEEIELIRDSCVSMRELALIDFLNTSGVRVSELIRLDRNDIDFEQKTTVVFGKGSKERVVYFSDAAKVRLKKYLSYRVDNDPALFVSPNPPYRRISRRGVEFIVNRIGNRAGVSECHPHRFRRSLATRLLTRGMPVEQVQKILGHTKIETTLIYAKVSDQDVKMNHSKYC